MDKEKYIDLGIDLGAENIIITATGFDNSGRKDYKLINLEQYGTLKNYIGIKDNSIEIGRTPKLFFANHNTDGEYQKIYGRYKGFSNLDQDSANALEIAIKELLKKLENYDFSKVLSGQLRNIAIGIPQDWSIDQKELYIKALSSWQHGKTLILPEPIAASLSAYRRVEHKIEENIMMIIDIGGATLDISFVAYNQKNQDFHSYPISLRSNWAGYYFDVVFLAFILFDDINKIASTEIINIKDRMKLRTIESYINEVLSRKYDTFLLELENIKENNLVEMIKFGRKKLLDTGKKTPLIVNKKIYDDALNYYASKIVLEINSLITKFKKNHPSINSKIHPFLCGGASSLLGLEKELKNKLSEEEKDRFFTLPKELSYDVMTDISISSGLAFYAQDSTLINKLSEYSLKIEIFNELTKEKDFVEIIKEKESIPVEKKLSELLSQNNLEYIDDNNSKIEFLLIKKQEDETKYTIAFNEIKNSKKGDLFDIVFSIYYSDILHINLINKTKNESLEKSIAI